MNEYRETWHGVASEETLQALLAASSASIGQTKIVDTEGHEAQVTESGELKVSGSGPSGNLVATHWSPGDGTVTYLTTSTLTCTGFPFTVDNATCVVLGLSLRRANGDIIVYENGVDGVAIGAFLNSTLRKRIVGGGDIKEAFLMWNKCGGKTLKGLTLRREAEANLYLA